MQRLFVTQIFVLGGCACACVCLTEREAIPIKIVSMEIVRLKVYFICSQSYDLALHSRLQLHLKLDKC